MCLDKGNQSGIMGFESSCREAHAWDLFAWPRAAVDAGLLLRSVP
jgi:hypothetical protein